jgi:hypothetical protein
MGKLTFITTLSSGHNPNSWDLPQNHVMAVKEGAGRKFIAYYKGEDTVFVEDMYQKNKDIKPSKVPSFEYNELNKRTELVVDDSDKNLVMYLKTHPWFKKKYNLTSKEIEAKKKISTYEPVEKALELIRDAGENEIKAISLAILGFNYFDKTQTECIADLKEKAFKEPQKIIDIMNASDYESRYIASLAFCNDIITTNPTSTAIIWKDNEGVILHVAKGESAVDKLTEFLSSGTAESQTLLQEVGLRVDKVRALEKTANLDSAKAAKLINSQESEIEKLKRELAEEKAKNAAPKEPTVDKYAGITLEEATKIYNEQNPKTPVPTAKEGNLDWIKSKLK